ncbi:TrkH family potassium uptake protein [Parvibaculum sp.]|uniref:TrkH family potassium uptake protein n=1 Tax=Parvibaculum sp. TaxID=2024848 RepID=UPI00272F76C5|nr:TrkH family potassium uptake protein [Parvibaculum sp.]MDP1625745.1 TrkH family potassium uptake protein [Parvibaculum sp.]MDP2149108.1 TrkH family potassium uptake protein [Parvibaculum sp.]MDP3328353.1 TrkH family potassium uptake protein [Parvibaculum sp.]
MDSARTSVGDSTKVVGLVIGALLIALSAVMLVPVLAEIVAKSGDWEAFLSSAVVTGFVGGALMLANQTEDRDLGHRATFLVTTLGWLSVSAFSALPFAFSQVDMNYTDAFFEAMSGVTTTGSTVMTGLDATPPGILLWRSLIQWIGGVGIILTAVAILPFLRVGGMQLFRTESSDRSEKVLPRPGQIAVAIGEVYLLLTLLCALAYILGGMTAFDALNHAMTTISTGGYSTHDASFGYFDSSFIHWAAIVFMISGALPLVLYVQTLRGTGETLWRDPQVRAFLTLIAAVSVTMSLWLAARGDYGFFEALRLVTFNVASVVTTTGFASTDYTLWGPFSVMAFFILIFLGGCTGSTSGGLKMFRLQILGLLFKSQVRQTLYPHVAQTMRYADRTVSREIVFSVALFVFVFMGSILVGALAISAFGIDMVTALSASAQAFANVGPGLGPIVGPAGNFASLPDGPKLILSFAMLLGRLELLTVLVMFSKDYWEK